MHAPNVNVKWYTIKKYNLHKELYYFAMRFTSYYDCILQWRSLVKKLITLEFLYKKVPLEHAAVLCCDTR